MAAARADGGERAGGGADPFDLGVRCGYFLPMKDGAVALERDVFLGTRDGRIAEISSWSEPYRARCRDFLDASGRLVMPGLVNAHTHLPMSLLRGLAEDRPLDEWLNKTIFPIEGKLLDEEFARAGAELALWESLLSGVTTVCDMYYFEDAVADAVDRAGLRGICGEAVVDFLAPDDKLRDGAAWRILDRMRERYAGHERITPAVAAHAPYTCSDATLRRARDYARTHGLPLVIHASETRSEVEESLRAHGRTPIERLHGLGVTGPRSVFIHCVHATHSEIDLMARTGTSAVYNPESNMKLSAGIAHVTEWLARGLKCGIGTDGSASNNDLNLFHEMDTGVKLQKLDPERTGAFTAAHALRMATIEGARALGLDDRAGSLEPGKAADLVVIDVSSPALQPLHDIPSQLVYSASGARVEAVVCAGRVLLRGGRPLTLDTEALLARVGVLARGIRSLLGMGDRAGSPP